MDDIYEEAESWHEDLVFWEKFHDELDRMEESLKSTEKESESSHSTDTANQ